MKYSKDTTLGEILQDNPKNSEVLMGFGMHCLGCPMSRRETIGQACEVHELDLDFVLAKLNGQGKTEPKPKKPAQPKRETKSKCKTKPKK